MYSVFAIIILCKITVSFFDLFCNLRSFFFKLHGLHNPHELRLYVDIYERHFVHLVDYKYANVKRQTKIKISLAILQLQ